MPADAAKRQAIIRAALMAPSPLSRYQPGTTRRAILGDVVLSAGPLSRHVLVLGPVTSDRLFRMAEAFFGDSGGFTCELDVESAGALADALQARGWLVEQEEPVLVLVPLSRDPPPAPRELAIHRVIDEYGLAHVHALSPSTSRWVPTLAAATDPAVALFVGYAEGRPIATSRLVCLGPTADLTSVGTTPEFRRRGYGTAMTWAAIAEGARRGCTAAMLSATAMGYPLYARMGFVPVRIFRSYIPP